MALARARFSFYSIDMKRLTSLFTLFACIFLSANVYAQNKGKLALQLLKPTVPENAVKAAKQAFDARTSAILSAVNQAVPLPKISPKKKAPIAKSKAATEAYLKEVTTIMDLPVEKEALNYAYAMELERSQARRLAATLKNYQTLNLSSVQEDELLDKISGVVVNHNLQKYLLNSMINKNYMQFMRDLANYYSLSVKFMTSYELRFIASQDVREVFAQTALDYMKAHPHKLNLKLREIMKSSWVSENIKSTLRGFIALNQILPQHESGFLTVLREAHKQYTAGLAAARSQESVTATVEIYKKTAKELEEFVKRYNRAPRWNAPLAERRLYNKLLLLITHNQANHFKLVAPYILQIRQLLTQNPHVRLSAVETLTQLQVFYKKYNRLPRAFNAAPGTRILEAELNLRESMTYWEMHDKTFTQKLQKLHLK